MSENVPQILEAKGSLNLVRSMLAPTKYRVAPPNLYYDSTFLKKITVQGVFEVADPSTLVEEKVANDHGLFIWFPCRGVNSIYRFGFVTSTTTSWSQGSLFIPGGRSASPGLSNALVNQGGQPWIDHLVYTAPLAVPYGQSSQYNGDQVTVSPDMRATISFARVASGVVEIQSDTVSTTATTLSGRVAWSAISDTRNIAQAFTGSDWRAYDPADLAQQGVTAKDGVSESSLYDGAVMIQGPDLNPQFTCPDPGGQDYMRGQWAKFYNRDPTGGVRTVQYQQYQNPWQRSKLSNIESTFISPWQVQAAYENGTLNFNGDTSFGYNLAVPAIDETGVLDIDATFQFNGNIPSTVNPMDCEFWLTEVHYIAEHFFVVCQSDGKLQYCTVREDAGSEIINWFALHQSKVDGTFLQRTVKFRPAMLRQGFATALSGGKYIGSLVAMAVTPSQTPLPATTNLNMEFYLQPTSFRIRARTIEEKGYVGPVRIVRYDSVGVGQNIRCVGQLNAQLVPQGNLSEYTQAQAGATERCNNLNVIPFAASLWNAENSDFKRMYNGKYYHEQIIAMADDLSPQGVMFHSKGNENILASANATGIVQAAGDFGDIGGALGGIAGSALGPEGTAIGSVVGKTAGNLLGKAWHGIFGAGQFGDDAGYGSSGQFSATNASGGFGPSMGQRRQRLL